MAFVVVKNFGNKSLSEILNLIQNDRGRVFPTHVGMNRTVPEIRCGIRWCSPHTWG